MKVINLFAGPGAGKSTTAAGLFYAMKHCGESVELVTEFAKELVYRRAIDLLCNQEAVFREQYERLTRLVGQVEYAITDSPLLLSLVYAEPKQLTATFTSTVVGAFDSFDNVNFFIQPAKPYQTYGRMQSEDEARAIDPKVRDVVGDRRMSMVRGDLAAPWRIYAAVKLIESMRNSEVPA